MKDIEKSIKRMHDSVNMDIPVVPLEFNKSSRVLFKNISSTYIAVICHFVTFLAFAVFTVCAWIL